MLRRISAISVLFVLGMAAQSQAALLTYQQVVQADNPSYYWTWQEASGNALNNGSAADGVLAPGSTAARAASTTNAGGLSLGTGASFNNSATQIWSTGGMDSPNNLNDTADYSSYAIEFWVNLTGTGAQYLSQTSAAHTGDNYPSVIYGFNTGKIELYTDGSGTRTGDSFSLSSGWHHVVLGYKFNTDVNDVQTCIIDGNYAGKITTESINGASYSATNAPITIGGSHPGGSAVQGGMMDEYAVYNLSSLDQAGYDAKMFKLAGHYGHTGVPEPGTFALLAAGLLGLLAYAWRKRK